MLNPFAKPRWQSKDAAKRAAAVASLQDEKLLSKLDEIASNDDNERVREAALRRSQSLNTLLTAWQRDNDNKHIAAERLIKLITQIDIADQATLQLVENFLGSQPTVKMVEQLAGKAGDKQIRLLALAQTSRPGFLGDRVLNDTDMEVRQNALQRIKQQSTLERIAGKLRKSNKNLYHQAQAILDSIRDTENDTENLDISRQQENAVQLCVRLETLVRDSGSVAIEPALNDAVQAWEALQIDSRKLQRRFDNARTILLKVISGEPVVSPEPPTKPANDTQKQTPVAPVPSTDIDERLQRLAEQFDALFQRRHLSDKAIQQWRQQWRSAWQQIEAPNKASQQLQDALSQRIQEREKQAQDHQLTQQQLVKDISDKNGICLKAIEDGKLKEATELRNDIIALRQQLSARPTPEIAFQLREIDGKLSEMRQWQRWSDNEQRARIIKKIETAVDAEYTPDALLSLIREARSRWDAMTNSEQAHGMRKLDDNHPLSRQFRGVIGRAMKQARPFLEKRTVVQTEREKLLQQLISDAQQLTDQDNADAKTLLAQKRLLGKAFKELGGIPPKHRKSMAHDLRTMQEKISAQLTKKFSAAETEKRKLIRQAEQLQHIDDHSEAISQAKQLQRRWKEAGPTTRKTDQELWNAFRQPIDPLFAELKEQREQAQEEQAEVIALQRQKLEEMQQLAEADPAELSGLQPRVQGLQHDWQEQAAEKKLQQAFNKAAERYRQRLADWQNDQQKAQWQEISDAAQQRQQQVAEQLAADSDNSQLLEQLSNRTDIARELCIAAEFMAGLPSPAEDQEARMHYQVKRLAERMGQQNSADPRSELHTLQTRWYDNLPINPDQFERLQSRFDSSINAAEKIVA